VDYVRAGDEAGFAAYLDDLRQRQRRKTSFIAKLDAAFTIGQAVIAVRAAIYEISEEEAERIVERIRRAVTGEQP
jgi:hypothetical protein